MTKTIRQTVRLPATARQLYDVYINPGKHAAFTGGPVTISPKPRGRFRAFGGQISGVTLFTVPGQMIVQRWRSTHFRKADADSILILTFTDTGRGGRIELTHINVPPQDHAGVTKGWRKYYWGPMRRYVTSSTRPSVRQRGLMK
jgi:activator of HSP90 ATPase